METLISSIDSAAKNGWISQAVERQSYGQTSQTVEGDHWGPSGECSHAGPTVPRELQQKFHARP